MLTYIYLMKQFANIFLRIVLTIIILFVIFNRINFQSTSSLIVNSNAFFLTLSFLTFFFFSYIISLRWKMLLNLYGFNISLWQTLKIYMISILFNNFLPSTVGMDVVRAAYIAEKGKRLSDVISSILIERWIGLLGIIFYVILVPIFFFGRVKIEYFIPFSLIGTIFSALFFIVISNEKIFNSFYRVFIRITVLKIGERINYLFTSLRIIRNHKKQLIINLFLSFIIQVIFVFTNYFIVLAQGLNISLTDLVIYIPFISIISMIPITINGMGLREWSYMTFFSSSPKEEAIALSISFFILSVIFSLLGIIFFLTEKRNTKENI